MEELVKFVFFGKLLYTPSSLLLTRCQSEEVHKFKKHRGDFIVPQANHAFKSYFHVVQYYNYRLILCCVHPLTDKAHVTVHKGDDAVVVLGVLVAYATALHHLKGFQ